ncbi:hypothetical protein B0I35DRAFT_436549 [Stachybotrys elegans]|uniref:USP domain-containing protein n=1 Tax=Stachybotrys elegans TaxID=80388 RepID=A0A8K0WNH5_9HYPO|nr:hypothetical protein B0I35DRAFT_436549 [Stachybotrys elegans]
MNSTSVTSLLENGSPMAAPTYRHNPPAYDGRNGTPARPGPGALPHIDDLVAIPRDVDLNLSIRKLLEMAEVSLRQAEMSRDFNRPAQALKDYIRASVIAVQFIRDHKDYTSLRDTSGELARSHAALLKKISSQNDAYSRIKREIIADNQRTGVQPSAPRQASVPSAAQAHPPSSGRQTPSRLSQEITNGKVKPLVNPKPQALHGNAIKPGHGRAGSTGSAQDSLLARFVNLKGPQASPGQDPRIKTHPILPKPAGPREMPSDKPRLSLQSPIPSLPKMPDAIYSPARGTGEGTRAPTSSSRPRFNRTGSSASISSIQQTPLNSYPQVHRKMEEPRGIQIPQGDTITPEQLFQAMKAKGSVLIIDVRSREEFSEGHIMSSATICVEPSILQRDNLSADQISESLVLSPNQERDQFDRRDKYDLVVVYDQDSEGVPQDSWNRPEAAVLMSMCRALALYNYSKELKNSPKILEGGLDAWVDLMGPASLQTTSSPAATRTPRGNITIERKRSKYTVKSLRPDEVRALQESMEKTNDAVMAMFARTTEDFLKRYPAVSLEKESMSSPVMPRPRMEANHLPSPPTRPAPALPRSYSGLTRPADEHEPETGTVRIRGPKEFMSKAPCGIKNPRNWCYAISILQALCASSDFSRTLSEWEVTKSRPPVPMKPGDVDENPQLMVRNLGVHFHWIKAGEISSLDIKSFMAYCKYIDENNFINDDRKPFGSDQQQDAQEFMSFILTHLHDETNMRRDRTGMIPKPDTTNQSLVQAAAEYWRNHSIFNDSLVDRCWRGIELSTVNCTECNTNTYSFSMLELIPARIPAGRRSMTLKMALAEHFAPNLLTDFDCECCHRKTHAKQFLSLARMPPMLCVAFSRFEWTKEASRMEKSTTPVTWDVNDFDFSPYFLRPEDSGFAGPDKAFSRPFRYECYAIIIHSGNSVNSGHYYSYVRDTTVHDPYSWFKCNDESVTKVRIGSNDQYDAYNAIFQPRGNDVPYLAFFRRRAIN